MQIIVLPGFARFFSNSKLSVALSRDTAVTQLQMVQDTNAILEQWRTHYEREIVHLQLTKVELESSNRQHMSENGEVIAAVSCN